MNLADYVSKLFGLTGQPYHPVFKPGVIITHISSGQPLTYERVLSPEEAKSALSPEVFRRHRKQLESGRFSCKETVASVNFPPRAISGIRGYLGLGVVENRFYRPINPAAEILRIDDEVQRDKDILEERAHNAVAGLQLYVSVKR